MVESNSQSVSPDRFDDLKDTMTSRFDELQHSLETLETKEHHAAELSHVNYRVNDLEDKVEKYHKEDLAQLDKFKATIWKAVTASSSVVAFIVGFIEWLISSH